MQVEKGWIGALSSFGKKHQGEKSKSVNSTKSARIEEQALGLEWLRKSPQAELYLCSVLEM